MAWNDIYHELEILDLGLFVSLEFTSMNVCVDKKSLSFLAKSPSLMNTKDTS
jgi:hypothetical protein